jgi:transposase-like protein
MTTYTDTQRAEALEAYDNVGTAEASRQTGISPTTIKRWAAEAGHVVQTNTQKTTTARAAAAERVQRAWGDYREGEAMGSGAAASRMRSLAVDAAEGTENTEERTDPDTGKRTVVTTGLPPDARAAKDLAIAYGIFVDKAELLSDRATSRIETWSESDVDRALREAVAEMEARARGDAPTPAATAEG